MTNFDYIVVGAGSAGSVLANRLSAHPGTTVLLLEAGGKDTNPMVKVPMGFAKLLGDPRYVWHYPVNPFGPSEQVEYWVRGKMLGGSSSVNGMVYNRGARADYDALEKLGNPGWGWDTILPIFKQLEDHQLGASADRGAGGPLHVSVARKGDPLTDQVIASAEKFGLQRVDDFNASDDERIGYTAATIKDGQRFSAARAFLRPASKRPNLTVSTGAEVGRVVIEGDRAVGVSVRENGQETVYRARREVILSAGSLASPKILQLSGIGPAEVLKAAGVDVVVDSPNVGGRMREHRCFGVQYRLNREIGYNRLLSTALRQAVSGTKYLATHRGPLAAPSFSAIGFFKTDPDLERPDAQMLVGPFSLEPTLPGQNPGLERKPGVSALGFVLRPSSEGSLHITSADPAAPLDITVNYFTSAHDRRVGVGLFRKMRELFASGPIANLIDHELDPGPRVRSDEQIIDDVMANGRCGYHAIGTCAMGPEHDDVVDSELRVRGVDGLRVVDCSVMPTMVSGNLNGPVMAMAWRAADLILGAV